MAVPSPRIVFWESTAACNLACRHCRRTCVPEPRTDLPPLTPPQTARDRVAVGGQQRLDVVERAGPDARRRPESGGGELTTAEAYALVDQLAEAGRLLFIISGGEPLLRPDIYDIAAYATSRGLAVAVATNATLVDQTAAERLAAAGVRRVSVSLDAADAAAHDAFRGLPGSFASAVRGIGILQRAGLPVQVNTTVSRHNVDRLHDLLALSRELGAVALHLFLLVPVGCGMEIAGDEQITPGEYERVLNWLYDAERDAGDLELRATCAPHYNRVKEQRLTTRRPEEQGPAAQGPEGPAAQGPEGPEGPDGQGPAAQGPEGPDGQGPAAQGPEGPEGPEARRPERPPDPQDEPAPATAPPRAEAEAPRGGHGHAPGGCLAGSRVCFVSHDGRVYGCGYLPLEAGSLREQSFAVIWEESPLFQSLRDPSRLSGKCGGCDYVAVCGGCRARAYGMSGDHLGEEPMCAYRGGGGRTPRDGAAGPSAADRGGASPADKRRERAPRPLPPEVRLGTRGSVLARLQTAHVAELLRLTWPGLATTELVITTTGDMMPDRPLPSIGGKGLFTAELEEALTSGAADLAVHSLKDLPTGSPAGLTIGAILPRADARDALVSRGGHTIETLPDGATVGTGSRRRAAQLLHLRPDLRIIDLRGNADTRLRKALAPDGPYDAIVIAAAALDRLGRGDVATETVSCATLVPAPGQGALAVQCSAEAAVLDLLAAIHDPAAAVTTAAERAFLDGLGGGCAVPIAAYATLDSGGVLELHGRVSAPDGERQIDVRDEIVLPAVAPEPAAELGRRMARRARAAGADAILSKLS